MRRSGLSGLKRWIYRCITDPYTNFRPETFDVESVFGARFEGTLGGLIQRRVFHFGIFEPNLTKWIGQSLRPGDTFLDVGANVGYFTLLGARAVGPTGSVVAIEAAPSTFTTLLKNCERNACTNVRALNLAAFDRETELPLFHIPSEENTGGASVVLTVGPCESIVQAKPLAIVLSESEIGSMRIVKIDVEGAEVEAVRGLIPAISRMPENVEIVVESMPINYEAISGMMEELGFHTYTLENPMEPFIPVHGSRRPLRHRGAFSRADLTMDHGVAYFVFSRQDRDEL